MTKKVTLPRDVAEAIESLRGHGVSDYGIIVGIEDADRGNASRHRQLFVELNVYFCITNEESARHPNALMSALVNGYEIEQSPEDKLREYYAELKGTYDSSSGLESYRVDGMLQSVETTLAILGIQIEGINA